MFFVKAFSSGCTLLVFVMLAARVHQTAGDPDPSVCVPQMTTPGTPNADQPVFPSMPQKMRAWSEIKDVYDNITYDVELAFDSRGDDLKMAANIRIEGYAAHISYNFVTNQVIYTTKGGFCFVVNFTDPTAATFKRYGVLADVIPLTMVRTLQDQPAAPSVDPPTIIIDNPVYIGTDNVRHIPVTKWTTCMYYSYPMFGYEGTYNATIYFSAPGYMMPSADEHLPVRYVVTGNTNITSLGKFDVFLSMDYFDVVVGPVTSTRAFEPPLGVVCPGRISQVPFPTDWPETFSLDVEVQNSNFQRYQVIREYYSYPDNIIAYEYQSWGIVKVGDFIRTVHDYNSGLSYDIDLNSGVCVIGPIPVDSGEAISPDGKHVILSSIKGFLNLKSLNWVYEGQSYQRNILTESWIVARTDWPASLIKEGWQVNSTWEYFFAAENWLSPAKFHRAVSHLPVLLKLQYTLEPPPDVDFPFNRTWYISEHLFGLYLEPFAPLLVDVSVCFDSSDSMDLAFDFDDLYVFDTYVVNNTNNFYGGVISSVANATNVSVTRITQTRVTQSSNGITTFYYKLLGTPPVDGDAFNMTAQTPLDEAYNLFATAISEGFWVTFPYQGERTSILADSDSLRQDFSPDNSGYSGGAMAGMAIGMFAAGVVICVSIGFALFKTSKGPFPYKTQE